MKYLSGSLTNQKCNNLSDQIEGVKKNLLVSTGGSKKWNSNILAEFDEGLKAQSHYFKTILFYLFKIYKLAGLIGSFCFFIFWWYKVYAYRFFGVAGVWPSVLLLLSLMMSLFHQTLKNHGQNNPCDHSDQPHDTDGNKQESD